MKANSSPVYTSAKMSVHYAAVYQGDKLIAEYPTPGGAFAAAVLSVLPQLAETGKKSSARRTFSVDGNSVHCLKRNKLLHFCVGTKVWQLGVFHCWEMWNTEMCVLANGVKEFACLIPLRPSVILKGRFAKILI